MFLLLALIFGSLVIYGLGYIIGLAGCVTAATISGARQASNRTILGILGMLALFAGVCVVIFA